MPLPRRCATGFMYTLPWTVPGPIGTIMGLGFQPLAFVMLALILVVDFVLYYPFFRAYDAQKCAEEAEISQEELAAKNAETLRIINEKIRAHELEKSYLCITVGRPKQPEGKIEGFLLKNEAKKEVRFFHKPVPGGKTAVRAARHPDRDRVAVRIVGRVGSAAAALGNPTKLGVFLDISRVFRYDSELPNFKETGSPLNREKRRHFSGPHRKTGGKRPYEMGEDTCPKS